ncbi:DNA helicase RecQ [Desulfoluna butyratoxydans]|uniref:DNA helicase RecQ n=1 Tax=Desulfoluna butyratoxydans TaxID=231438 RepID=A0A4U8YT89_9BACT|nr:DNA helicase RecQ [Desulfoluna butyratoxydans]VFQ47044.1 dna helicase atp-dependent recq type bacterial [Desulfoluna butyratoxydans]
MHHQPPETILKNVFGYEAFRGNQKAIIDNLLSGGDALVLMPTGGGKSLCYQIPGILRPGTAVVVSPLIALMQDQVEALRQNGVRAGYLNSSLSQAEALQVERAMAQGEMDLVYVAPERLMTPRFQELLTRTPLALFAIDEAHCVSQWGHDFRPEYMQLAILAERFPQVPRIALTATADPIVREEMAERLHLTQAKRFVSSFDRPNIRYRIVVKNTPKKQLLDFLEQEHNEDSGIVYCLSRKKVESTAAWLSDKGFTALPYHAGLPQQTRAENQRRFITEEQVIIVATIAFGMGIDKPDVRFVAHLDLPKNLESYYQETGRAGRDGLPADAWMAYSLGDAVFLRQMLDSSEGNEQFKRIQHQKLNAMLGFCEITGCRRQALLAYFGETLETACGNCDTCLSPVDTWEGTTEAQKALSCIYRTGQRYGAGHLIDVLLGKGTDKVELCGHDCVSTFGIGKELSDAEWRSVYRQLVAGGLISVNAQTGGFRLNEKSMPVLKGQQQVSFRKDPTPTRRGKQAGRRSNASRLMEEVCVAPGARALWDKLKAYRKETAAEAEIPPYLVFNDATLADLIDKMPTDDLELLAVSGIGQQKLSSYGDEILAIIDEHLKDFI